ncbi:TRAP transporter small permease subunit [uncultured Microbacterium sp.]|uniref:TRAP transporter small permease n=1 Tax=uncultured Microbacterium sp. TaxID=191216 RepID=UPI002634BE0A|nr:TRAP transporter small permease subunit [uncultured Microbacterium sp.]
MTDETPIQAQPEDDTFEVLSEIHTTLKRERMWHVVDALLALGVFGMLVAIVVQIVGRVAGSPPVWSEELARFLFMDGVFLGMAAGFRIAAHPRMSYLVAKGPAWLGKLSIHLTMLSAVFVFGVLAWKGVDLMIQQMRTNETSPALGLSMWIVTVPFILSALLAIVGTVQGLYFDKNLRRRVLEGEVIA